MQIKNYSKIFAYKVSNLLIRVREKLPKFQLIKILEKNFVSDSRFSFILIGANDGISHDSLFPFLKERHVSGIAVEPLPDVFLKLDQNFSCFPQVRLLNLAVHPSLKQVFVYRVKPEYIKDLPEWVNGIASILPEHHKKVSINSEMIMKEEVNALPFMDICRFCNIYNVDLLQVDVEGFDFEVLKMVDFSLLKPKIIKYESINLEPANQKAAWSLLEKNGYFLFTEGIDTIAVDLSKVQL